MIITTDLSVYLHDPPTTGNGRAALGLLEALRLLHPDPPAARDWSVRKREIGHSVFLHIPTTRCFHSIPSRRAAKQEQALLDSPLTATGASRTDPLRCIGKGYLSVPMQSIPVARRGFKHAGQVNTQQDFIRTSQIRGRSHQKQLPYSFRLTSAECLIAVSAARPVAFVWYDFWPVRDMTRSYCVFRIKAAQSKMLEMETKR